jgi:hypothetical protein
MRVGTIYWNENADTTTIKWSDIFMADHQIVKLDVIKDLQKITDLAYDHVYENENAKNHIPSNVYGE